VPVPPQGPAAHGSAREAPRQGTHFTCFTSTKAQMLTAEEVLRRLRQATCSPSSAGRRCCRRSIYICLRILLYMCPHATTCVRAVVCGHIYRAPAAYYCICVRMLLYVCALTLGSSDAHTSFYMCPHTTIGVLILAYISTALLLLYMCPHTTIYCYTCVGDAAAGAHCVRIPLYLCCHTPIYVSSCYHTCVLALRSCAARRCRRS
jgi:hypothetical protein